MFDNIKKWFYWAILISLSLLCIIITLKVIYYIFVILATIGLAIVIKNYIKYGKWNNKFRN